MNTLFFAASFLAFFLALLAFSKKNSSTANKLLVLLLSLFGFQIFLFSLSLEKNYFYGVLYLRTVIPFLYGPLIYFYIMFLSGARKKLNRLDWLHFSPFLLILIYEIVFLYFSGIDNAVKYYDKTFIYHFGKYLVITSAAAYILAGLVRLRTYKKGLADKYSFTEKINLQWISGLLYSFLLTWVTIWIALSLNRIYTFIPYFNESLIIYPALSLFIVFLGFFGIRQTDLFTSLKFQSMTDSADKYSFKKDDPSQQNFKLIFQRIESIVEKEKLFLEPQLSVKHISEKISVNENYISNAINSGGGCTFFEYINTKRIEEFKKRLNDPANSSFTLLAIAFECGFNSRSSFNRIFKKLTGQTPSKYQSSLNS